MLVHFKPEDAYDDWSLLYPNITAKVGLKYALHFAELLSLSAAEFSRGWTIAFHPLVPHRAR